MGAFCYAIVSPVRAGAQQSAASAQPGANAVRTVWAGVYNATQAKRGEAVSVANCMICHGDELLGNEPPGLVGPDFLAGSPIRKAPTWWPTS
jgi:mono/diheme cytochrome c family protein